MNYCLLFYGIGNPFNCYKRFRYKNVRIMIVIGIALYSHSPLIKIKCNKNNSILTEPRFFNIKLQRHKNATSI